MKRSVPLLITVDGPGASGKSTLTRMLSRSLNVPYLYTGMMYRAVTWMALRKGVDLRKEKSVARIARDLPIGFSYGNEGAMRVHVGGRDATLDLAKPEISRLTSTYVAPCLRVRRCLVIRQRRYLTRKGLVAEGRDCGSVVFPDAPYKFFITADLKERSLRRLRDLKRAGIRQSIREVEADLRRRDREDAERKEGRLTAQPDSWIIDNTSLSVEDTLERLLRRIDRDGL